MKILFTFIFIIISPNIFASNLKEWNKWFNKNYSGIESEMSCKITKQVVFDVDDGKPKTYDSYKDKPKIGDRLTLMFYAYGDILRLTVKHSLEEYIENSMFAEKGKGIRSKSISFRNNVNGILKYYFNTMRIFSDRISYQYSSFEQVINLEMSRYYKSDWDGIFTSINGEQTQVMTLDCRSVSDKFDEIIKRYNTYPGKLDVKK